MSKKIDIFIESEEELKLILKLRACNVLTILKVKEILKEGSKRKESSR